MSASASAAAAGGSEDGTVPVDAAFATLSGNAEAWWNLSAAEKLGYLRKMRVYARESHDARVAAAATHRNPGGDKPSAMSTVTATLMNASLGSQLSLYVKVFETLAALEASGTALKDADGSSLPLPQPLQVARTTADGRKVVSTWPLNALERATAAGARTETYLEAGSAGQNLDPAKYSSAGVTLVFTPGNFEALWEVLHALFTENRVVAAKAHPVNGAATLVALNAVCKDLIADGYVQLLDASMDTARAALAHPAVTDLSITGSHHTYNAIVWGPGAEGEANRAKGTKAFDKPVTAELGGCGPVVVVPGDWTPQEVDHCASSIVSYKFANGGHICVSPQVIITAKGWEHRDALLAAIRKHASAAAPPNTYYPGAAERFAKTTADVEAAGVACDRIAFDELAETTSCAATPAATAALFTGVDDSHALLSEEIFGLGLVETSIDVGADADPAAFLPAAVDFCNKKVWGNLSANIWIDPRTQAANQAALTDAVDALEAGLIGVNEWAAMLGISPAPWGAHAGSNSPEDIRSGMGHINNAARFDRPQKSVIWSPFMNPNHPKPISSVASAAQNDLVYKRLFGLLNEPGWLNLLNIASAKYLNW